MASGASLGWDHMKVADAARRQSNEKGPLPLVGAAQDGREWWYDPSAFLAPGSSH